MRKSILNELNDLVKENVISADTAQKIKDYYSQAEQRGSDRSLIVFAILGSILMALGIILIVAHNWDDLSRELKTVISFVPLVTGQVLCLFTLLKKYHNTAWRESVSAFLVLSIGTAISLISQIYNIPGGFNAFMLTWALLSLPVVYIMQSSVASLLYIAGITSYAVETGYYTSPDSVANPYWLLLLLIMPFYYILYRVKPASNFMLFHHWFIPASIIICLGIVANDHEEILFLSYLSLFAFFYLIGKSPLLNKQRTYNNSYLILGSAGMMTILLMLSFDWFWKELYKHDFSGFFTSPEFVISAVIILLSVFMLLYNLRKKMSFEFPDGIFLIFILIFITGYYYPSLAVILINLLILTAGITTIIKGAKLNHLGILNYGLIIITALVISRFFDTDLSFVLRGILFLIVGSGFFMLNYWMIKRRKLYDK